MRIIQLNHDTFLPWKEQIAELLNISAHINFPEQVLSASYGSNKCADLEAYLKDGSAVVFCAVEQEKLLGWIWCHSIRRLTQTRLHIAEIAVSEDCRNKGVGRQLLENAEAYAVEHGIREIDLLVTASNAAAVAFYEKMSFSPERYLMKKTVESKYKE